MDQSLIKLLKKENKKITMLRFKLGWWAIITFSITYIIGMGLIFKISPKSSYYWICFWIGIILLIFSTIFLFYFSKKINKKVNIRLKANSEKHYTKRVIKEYLISSGYYHPELIENLITTFESRYKDKINAALIITLIIFVISPAWGLILNIAYNNTKKISVIFIFTSFMFGIVFFIYLLARAINFYRYFLDNYISNQLKELSIEYLFEEINNRKD